MPDFAIERRCEGVVCGIDEAGRGPLAGPVVAAAVIIDRRRFRGELRRCSTIRRRCRASCARAAMTVCAPAFAAASSVSGSARRASPRSTGSTCCAPICSRCAARRRRWRRGPARPDVALVDGNIAPILPCAVRTIVRGNSLSLSIAAASIVAKVTRDRIMRGFGARAIPAMAGRPMPGTTAEHVAGDPPARRDAAPSPLVRADSPRAFSARRSACATLLKPTPSRYRRTSASARRGNAAGLTPRQAALDSRSDRRAVAGAPSQYRPRRPKPAADRSVAWHRWSVGDALCGRPRRRMRKRGKRGMKRLGFVLPLLLLAACSTAPPQPRPVATRPPRDGPRHRHGDGQPRLWRRS